jgi:hypothetical protein
MLPLPFGLRQLPSTEASVYAKGPGYVIGLGRATDPSEDLAGLTSTAKARAAFASSFERLVDPDRKLPPMANDSAARGRRVEPITLDLRGSAT